MTRIVKVIVLGADLIGVASAYYLWRDGHDVEVIEQHAEAASVTSYANACLVSASRALPWPTPAAHKTIWRALTDASAPMRVTKFFDPALWRWGREFLSYANRRDYEQFSQTKLSFAKFGQNELEDTLVQTGVDCGYKRDGLLYVCRSDATMTSARARAVLVGKHDYEVRVLSRGEVLALEPSLASSCVVGGTLAVTDAQGDSRAFTRQLAAWLAAQRDRAVRFSYGETVSAKLLQRGRTFQISTPSRALHADAFVVALGPQTPHFARMLGVHIPIYPVKGFSITVPVKDASRAPQRGGICEDSLIAYCPLHSPSGPVMRITTGAILSGQNNGFADADFVPHREQFEALFSGALDWASSAVEHWACQRPMTPSSLPIIQRDARFDNIYWNCGQGHIGWTMSCGSGRVMADLVAGRKPYFSLENMQQL